MPSTFTHCLSRYHPAHLQGSRIFSPIVRAQSLQHWGFQVDRHWTLKVQHLFLILSLTPCFLLHVASRAREGLSLLRQTGVLFVLTFTLGLQLFLPSSQSRFVFRVVAKKQWDSKIHTWNRQRSWRHHLGSGLKHRSYPASIRAPHWSLGY